MTKLNAVMNFPLSNIRNISLFYLFSVVINSWWISANWIFFWTRYMTYGSLGLVDALAFGFGLLMEIPTGAIADLLGKRKTIISAMSFALIGISIITFSDSYYGILIGFLICQLGWALYSGAAEAMAYDTLIDEKKETQFEEVITTYSTIAGITTLITTLIGGFLYSVHFRLPHILWVISYVFGLALALFIKEPKTVLEKFTLKNYFLQLKIGFKELFKTNLRQYIVFFFALYGSFIIYDWGLVKPAFAERFGYLANEQAILFTILGIITAILVRFIPRIRKIIGDKIGMYILSILLAMAYAFMFFNWGFAGFIPLALLDLSGRIVYPWLSIIINKEIPSKYRATTISTTVLLSRLPYVFVAIIAGEAAQNGQLGIFGLGIGVILISLVAINFLYFDILKRGTSHSSSISSHS